MEDVASVGVRFAGGAVGTIHGGYDLPARGYRGRLALRGLERSVELAGEDELVVLAARRRRAPGRDAPGVPRDAGGRAMARRAAPQ